MSSRPARVTLAAALGLAGLLAASIYLRTRSLGQAYWIDEGLSVGIASYPLGEIPDVLARDGSPPLYYALLHLWMDLFGSGERATGALSLVFACLAVPVAFWIADTFFSRRAAWAAAVLVALNPFLTTYAQETRMYSLLLLLGLLATAFFTLAFVRGRPRPFAPAFALVLALALYTHNWALFLLAVAGCAAAVLALRGERRVAMTAAVSIAAALVAYAPWIPTLLNQAADTGAPWSTVPGPGALLHAFSGGVFGGIAPALALALIAGVVALRAGRSEGWGDARPALASLIGIGIGTVALAWVGSQIEPAWATRYLAVSVGALLVALGAVLARAGAIGMVALVAIAAVWVGHRAPNPSESSERSVAAGLRGEVRAGDIVLSTQPERLPVLSHYLRAQAGLTYASVFGVVPEPAVMDWRDALNRLRGTAPAGRLDVLVHALRRGARLVVVRPVIGNGDRWRSRWNDLVRRRSGEWARAAADHPMLRRIASVPTEVGGRGSGVRATVFVAG